MRYRRNRQGGRYAMTGRQRLMYRLCLLGVLIAVMAFTAVYGYFELRGRIPDEITLFQEFLLRRCVSVRQMRRLPG